VCLEGQGVERRINTTCRHHFLLTRHLLRASRIDPTPLSERYGLVLTAFTAWRVDSFHMGDGSNLV